MARATKKKAVAVRASTDVVAIQEAIAKQRENQGGALGTSGGAQVKIREDLQIAMPDGTSGEEISVIIVDFHARKTQYDTTFNPSDPAPPDCWAIAEPASIAGGGQRGDIHSTLSPDSRVLEPKADSCGSCPLNEFGTGGRSGTGKACNDRYWLIVAAANNPTGPLFELNVMVTSKKAFEAYVTVLSSQWQQIPLQAITLISAVRIGTSNAWQFSYGGENESFMEYYPRQEEARTMLEVGYQTATTQLPKATKKKAARRTKRRAAS